MTLDEARMILNLKKGENEAEALIKVSRAIQSILQSGVRGRRGAVRKKVTLGVPTLFPRILPPRTCQTCAQLNIWTSGRAYCPHLACALRRRSGCGRRPLASLLAQKPPRLASLVDRCQPSVSRCNLPIVIAARSVRHIAASPFWWHKHVLDRPPIGLA